MQAITKVFSDIVKPYIDATDNGLINNDFANGAVNLLNPVLESQVIYGITVTNNGDGSYTLNGSSGNSTGTIFFTSALKLNAGYSYKGVAFISGGMITSSTGRPSYAIDDRSGTQWYSLMNLNTEANQIIVTSIFTINADVTNYRCGIWVPTNTTFNNVIVKPMVISASIMDYTFVPYAKSNKELTEDVSEINTELSERFRNVSLVVVSTNIFNIITNLNTYPDKTCYYEGTKYFTNGSTALHTLLGVNENSLLTVKKYNKWQISIEVNDANHEKMCWAWANQNSAYLTFLKIDGSSSPATISTVTVNKAT